VSRERFRLRGFLQFRAGRPSGFQGKMRLTALARHHDRIALAANQLEEK
jgi:hypothetical protein